MVRCWPGPGKRLVGAGMGPRLARSVAMLRRKGVQLARDLRFRVYGRAGKRGIGRWFECFTKPLMLLLCVSACDQGVVGSNAVVEDSAGVRISQNGHIDLERVAWNVSEEPLHRVGWSDGGPEFGFVNWGFLTSDDRVVVGDSRPRRIIAITDDGEVAYEFGREGEGPGELGIIEDGFSLGNDSLVVHDLSNWRFSIYDRGAFVRQVDLRQRYSTGVQGAPAQAIGVLPGGRMVLAEELASADRFEDSWGGGDIVVAGVDGARWDTVGSYDAWAPRNLEWGTFTPRGYVAVSGEWIVTARRDRAEIRWLNHEGVVKRIARWQNDPPPVTDEFIEARIRFRVEGLPQEEVDRRRRELAEVEGPLPYFGELHGDSGGNVWLRAPETLYRDEREYLVFTAEGRWLGRVEGMPEGRILDIGDDKVLLLQSSPLDVHAVAVYRLEKARR